MREDLERKLQHRQPRRVDYTTPGFVRPPDPVTRCHVCTRPLYEGDHATASDWTTLTAGGPRLEVRYEVRYACETCAPPEPCRDCAGLACELCTDPTCPCAAAGHGCETCGGSGVIDTTPPGARHPALTTDTQCPSCQEPRP